MGEGPGAGNESESLVRNFPVQAIAGFIGKTSPTPTALDVDASEYWRSGGWIGVSVLGGDGCAFDVPSVGLF